MKRALVFVALLAPCAVAAQSNIRCSAGVSPGALAFGTVVPNQPAGTTRLLGDVVVRCDNARDTPPNAINVSIGISAGNSGSVGQRQMRSAGAPVPLLYNLYQDPGLASLWTDNLGANKIRVAVSPGSTTETRLPVYGAIPGNQTAVRPGLYSDTLRLTFRF